MVGNFCPNMPQGSQCFLLETRKNGRLSILLDIQMDGIDRDAERMRAPQVVIARSNNGNICVVCSVHVLQDPLHDHLVPGCPRNWPETMAVASPGGFQGRDGLTHDHSPPSPKSMDSGWAGSYHQRPSRCLTASPEESGHAATVNHGSPETASRIGSASPPGLMPVSTSHLTPASPCGGSLSCPRLRRIHSHQDLRRTLGIFSARGLPNHSIDWEGKDSHTFEEGTRQRAALEMTGKGREDITSGTTPAIVSSRNNHANYHHRQQQQQHRHVVQPDEKRSLPPSPPDPGSPSSSSSSSPSSPSSSSSSSPSPIVVLRVSGKPFRLLPGSGMPTLTHLDRAIPADDPRIDPHHELHDQLAWVSCVWDGCLVHAPQKLRARWMPGRPGGVLVPEEEEEEAGGEDAGGYPPLTTAAVSLGVIEDHQIGDHWTVRAYAENMLEVIVPESPERERVAIFNVERKQSS